MGISETIVAAIIGALATMLTAIVQLVRNRAPTDGRPKPKKNRMRSVLATIALMIGCIVGGYAWSSLRAVSAKEELAATMEAEFTKQFAALAARQNPESTGNSLNPAADPTAIPELGIVHDDGEGRCVVGVGVGYRRIEVPEEHVLPAAGIGDGERRIGLVVGGDAAGQMGVDDTTFPIRMEVDYVRVYQP